MMMQYAGYIVYIVVLCLSLSALVEIARLVTMLRDRALRKRNAAKRL